MFKFLRIETGHQRVFGLDILRAIAILIVVLSHGQHFLPKAVMPYAFWNKLLDGVSIFFVLSGFLIGRILIKNFSKEKLTLKHLYDFLIRRWLRTIPNYFLVLIILTCISVLYDPAFNIGDTFKYYFFLQNLHTEIPRFFHESWSLCVEEWFYLLIPFSIFLGIKLLKFKLQSSILFISLMVTVVIAFIRYHRLHAMPGLTIFQWDFVFRKQVITRLDSICYGVLGAYISFYHPKTWAKSKIYAFAAGLLLVFLPFPDLAQNPFYFCVLSFCKDSLAVLLLLPFFSSFNIANPKALFYRLITYISLTSYSVYLLHLSFVNDFLIETVLKNIIFNHTDENIIAYLFYLFSTFFLSILLYKYFELPVMRLREKL